MKPWDHSFVNLSRSACLVTLLALSGCNWIVIPKYSATKLDVELSTVFSIANDGYILGGAPGNGFELAEYPERRTDQLPALPGVYILNFFPLAEDALAIYFTDDQLGDLAAGIAVWRVGAVDFIRVITEEEQISSIPVHVNSEDSILGFGIEAEAPLDERNYQLTVHRADDSIRILDIPDNLFVTIGIGNAFIGENEEVVANLHLSGNDASIIRWAPDATEYTTISPDDSFARVRDMNARGVACGFGFPPELDPRRKRGWAYRGDWHWLDNPIPGDFDTEARSVQLDGDIVGVMIDPVTDMWRVVFWRWSNRRHRYIPIDITDNLPGGTAGNLYVEPDGVTSNDKGEIVLVGDDYSMGMPPPVRSTYLLQPSGNRFQFTGLSR